MSKNHSILESLDAFIRKYYKNLLIRGVIYFVALLVSAFIIFVLIEHFGYLARWARALLFWFYVVGSLALLWRFVVLPLLKMNRLGKIISQEEAARIIGKYFPEVADKLLNLLQLQKQDISSDSDLLQASIEQKTKELKPIPFTSAINLKDNRKYLKYAVVPLLVLLAFFVASPTLVTEPSKRIINYSTVYERPAPFHFILENTSLESYQQEDFEIKVAVEGEAYPNEVYVNVENQIYKMQALDRTHFSYVLKNLHQSRRFFFSGGGVESEEYSLTVFPKPTIASFQVLLSYPSYTGRASETLANEGDMTIPEGTVARWTFQTKDADTLFFDDQPLSPNENGRVSHQMRVMQPLSYCFYVKDRRYHNVDTLRYSISVISDAAPMIAVIETADSTLQSRLFFHGRIKDDYGFSKLAFIMVRNNASEPDFKDSTATLIDLSSLSQQEFYYSVNTDEWSLRPGDKVQYYFQVWDNDAIHGPKCAKSQQFELEIPTEKELENILERNSHEARQSGESGMSELKKLQEEINDIMRRMVDKKDLNWQDKKELQELAKKQQEVKQMLNQMQEQLKENNRLEQKYREQNEQIIEKQRELDRLFNEVMTEEMKEMMKEIDKLLQETDKKKVQEHLENLKIDNKELEKSLDQNIELMKRLEMEKKVESTIQKIDKIAERQKELSQQAEKSKGKDNEQLKQSQEQLSQEFKEVKRDIEQIQKEYKDIDKSIDFNVDKELEKSIETHQNEASEKLGKGKNKDASQQQKAAADEMEKLSEQLAEAQMDLEQSDLAEDAEEVRQLLKNLVHLSFNQEGLIDMVNKTYIQDPQYQSIISDQNKIKDDFRNIEDSLRAMAKRQIAVASTIATEVGSINSNIAKSLRGLLDMNQAFYGRAKNTGSARSMQYTMTSFNNLALMLAESLDKMQNQMRQNQQKKNSGSCKNKSKKSQSSCSNPGSSKPSAKSMKQMQEELNKQMESLRKQMEKEGKNKPGGRKKIGKQNSVSEQFAKMAAQQEMIRRMMQEYGQEMKASDAGNTKLAKEIEDMMRQMEMTETDLVNKTITQQTLRRQQQIMTRLLQHEKAEMEREKEQRRESHEGKELFQPSQSDLEQFKKLQQKNIDLFRTTPPTLSPFYKSKVDDYFYRQ